MYKILTQFHPGGFSSAGQGARSLAFLVNKSLLCRERYLSDCADLAEQFPLSEIDLRDQRNLISGNAFSDAISTISM